MCTCMCLYVYKYVRVYIYIYIVFHTHKWREYVWVWVWKETFERINTFFPLHMHKCLISGTNWVFIVQKPAKTDCTYTVILYICTHAHFCACLIFGTKWVFVVQKPAKTTFPVQWFSTHAHMHNSVHVLSQTLIEFSLCRNPQNHILHIQWFSTHAHFCTCSDLGY